MPLGWSIFNKDNLEHLISVLKKDYKINIDWEGTQCLMPTIRQEQGTSVHVWVRQDSNCTFWPQTSRQTTNATWSTYNPQLQHKQDSMQKQTTNLQPHPKLMRRRFLDKLLVSSWALGSWFNPPLSLFSTPQLPPKPSQQRTQWNMELIKWHLKYAATNLDAILIFKKSNMVLSSASYLTSLPLEDAPAKTSSAPLILVNHPKTAPYIILNIS